jgi:hypothetical protein
MGSQRSGVSVTESQKERARAAFGKVAKKTASGQKQPSKAKTGK